MVKRSHTCEASQRRRKEVLRALEGFNESALEVCCILGRVSGERGRECGCMSHHLWEISEAIAALGAAGMLSSATWDAMARQGVLSATVKHALAQFRPHAPILRPCCMRSLRAVIASCEEGGSMPNVVRACQRALKCMVLVKQTIPFDHARLVA